MPKLRVSGRLRVGVKRDFDHMVVRLLFLRLIFRRGRLI